MAEKKKKTIVIDGKTYNLEDFDDTREWSVREKLSKRKIKKEK